MLLTKTLNVHKHTQKLFIFKGKMIIFFSHGLGNIIFVSSRA